MTYTGTQWAHRSPQPDAKESQLLTVDGSGGTYTLTITVPGNATFITGAIAFNASPATVQASINTALAGIGLTCASASGGVGSAGGATPYTLTFDYPVFLHSNATMLTGGAATAIAVEATEGPIREVRNATDYTLPATSLPAKISTAPTRVVHDRKYETIA